MNDDDDDNKPRRPLAGERPVSALRLCDHCKEEIDSYAAPGGGFYIYCTRGCPRHGIHASRGNQ